MTWTTKEEWNQRNHSRKDSTSRQKTMWASGGKADKDGETEKGEEEEEEREGVTKKQKEKEKERRSSGTANSKSSSICPLHLSQEEHLK